MMWKRYRFVVPDEDYRPVAFPPPGPYWCSGECIDGPTLVAWLPSDVDLLAWWPDAIKVDMHAEASEPQFSDRFAKPDWWPA